MNHSIRSGRNVVNNECKCLQWLNVYIEQRETSTNLTGEYQYDNLMIKDQENLISDKMETNLKKFLESISQCDDAFDGDCVRRFVETDARESTGNKNSDNKMPATDQGKNKNRKSRILEAKNELWSIFVVMKNIGKAMEETETSNNQFNEVYLLLRS